MGGRSERTPDQAKWQLETHSVTYAPGLSTLSNLLRIVAKPPPSLLSCPRPPSHHPSSLALVYLVPILHLLLPSTTFWLYGTHTFFPHTQIISILSASLYSLIPFIFQLSYAPLRSQLYKFMTLQPNFSNTSSQEHSLSFSQHFSNPMPLLHTKPLVILASTHSYRHLLTGFYPQSTVTQNTFQRSPRSIPLILSVYDIPFTWSISYHLRSQVFKTIHFL